MKKYFSWFSLLMALPMVGYMSWVIHDIVSNRLYCKKYGVENYYPGYVCYPGSIGQDIISVLPWFVALCFIYGLSFFITRKVSNKGVRTLGLGVLWVYFVFSIAFGIVVYGLDQALK
jgi:hypothetical protein